MKEGIEETHHKTLAGFMVSTKISNEFYGGTSVIGGWERIGTNLVFP